MIGGYRLPKAGQIFRPIVAKMLQVQTAQLAEHLERRLAAVLGILAKNNVPLLSGQDFFEPFDFSTCSFRPLASSSSLAQPS